MRSVDHFFEKMSVTQRRLVISGAVALQTVLSLSADTPALDKKEAISLRKITEYWDEGNYTTAKTHILDYISTYPESSYLNELYAMLGDLYFQDKSYEQALSTYEKITAPSCKEFISLHRMEALFLVGKYEEAIACGRDLSINKDGNEANITRFLLLRAESLYRLAIKMESGLDQKKTAHEALEAYSQVPEDATHHVSLAVAHLHALVGEDEEAAKLYLQLAETIPEKQEELYFRAASQLVATDPSKALDLFQKVIARQGDFQAHAIFNRLILLYKQKIFAQFVEEYDRYAAILKNEYASSLLFCRSIASFQLDRFAESIAPLQALVQTNTLSLLQTRQALLSLFFCAQKTSDLELISKCLQMWGDRLPLDEGYLRGLLVKSQLAIGKKEVATASATLKEILERFPECDERESVLFDYAQSLALAQNWAQARESFQQFLEEYTSSPSTPLAWQHLIFCSMQLLKEGSSAEKDALKGCLVIDLQSALENTPSLDAETTRVYKRGIAQLNFELGQHKEALVQAEDYIQNYPEDHDAQSMRLMATACLMMLHSPPQAFISLAEETLARETDPQTQGRLRLQLFNAYLSISEEDEAAPEKAGEHLLVVYQQKTAPIKRENLLWLADYLTKKSDTASMSKATAVLEDALQFNGKELTPIDELDAPLLESYALRLATLYDEQNMTDKAAMLLSSLVRLIDTNDSASWQQRRHILFSLAQLEEKLGRTEHALVVYTRLIEEAAYASASYYRRAALLSRAKLQYAALSLEEKQSESMPLLSILDTLKELQITKNIHSEPTHLEAALEYAAMRSFLVDSSEQAKKFLFYLKKIKEDFTSQADETSLQYHEQRRNLPEKDVVFCAYMRFIDLEVNRCNSLKERQEGNEQYALLLEAEVKLELEDLLSLRTIVKTPLVPRIQRSLEKIGTSI